LEGSRIAVESTFYYLEELDETLLASSIAGNRLKRFFIRGENEQPGVSEESTSILEANRASGVDEFDNIY